jgi:RNA polymerase sigma-70 factor (ECF subfamily)
MGESAEPDDDTLVAEMQRGSGDALATVLRRYGPRVKGYLMRFRSRLPELDIDAALNAAACNLWRTIATYDSAESTLLGWFIRIAHNAALDELRKAARHAAGELTIEPELRPVKASEQKGDGAETQTERRLRLMNHVITKELKGNMRAVAIADLIAGGDADRKELAGQLGIPVAQVDVTRSQARKRVRELVTKLEQAELKRAGKS